MTDKAKSEEDSRRKVDGQLEKDITNIFREVLYYGHKDKLPSLNRIEIAWRERKIPIGTWARVVRNLLSGEAATVWVDIYESCVGLNYEHSGKSKEFPRVHAGQ